MNRYVAFAALLVLAAFASGGVSGGSGGQSDIDQTSRMFGLEPNAPNQSFTASSYLAPRIFTKKAGSVLCFDDGDSSFATFVAISDSIYNARGIRVRGTAFIVPEVIGTAGVLTLAQVRELNTRQDEFELGSHALDADRLGGRGLSGAVGTNTRVDQNGVLGMSYEFVDAELAANQDSAASWGITPFRSHGFSNWRRQDTLGPIFEKHGYFQAKGLGISAELDTANALPNETSAMAFNSDPFPPAFCGQAGIPFQGFHRHGLMLDPFNIGSRGSYSTVSGGIDSVLASFQSDTLQAHVSVAVQSCAISILTLHGIRDNPGRGIEIHRALLVDLMDHIADLDSAGVLESLTFEQAAARMRGIPDGDMMPTYNFKKISDITSDHLTQILHQPIGFAAAGTATPSFYSNILDTLVAVGGTATNWKVLNQAVTDTVLISFSARDTDTLETTHGTSSRTGNILIAQGISTANSAPISRTYAVSGSKGRFLQVNVQAMVLNTTSVNGYLSCKGAAFEHKWEDFTNGGAGAFAILPRTMGSRGAGIDTTNIPADRQAIRPQVMIAYADTAGTAAHLTATANFTSVLARTFWWSTHRLAPYILHERTDAAMWDHTASFGNEGDFDAAGGAQDTHVENLPVFSRICEPESYSYRIPIDERSDYVQAMFSIERTTTAFGATPEIVILSMDSRVIR